MGLQELTPFLRETVRHVHDLAVLHTAWLAAGHFGPDGAVYRRFTELGKTDADRKALAELMFTCVSNAIHHAMQFVDERNTIGQIEVTVSDGCKPYTLHNTDMVIHWFQMILEEHSKESPESFLQEIERVAAGGAIPSPEHAEFPPVRAAE
ncbi:MAG TPA: hypothetical protein VGR35_23290 [Tepidisphaeraceae bacterium]|nr:hypothetical protein [Tepidisphaeraceae bacterium]